MYLRLCSLRRDPEPAVIQAERRPFFESCTPAGPIPRPLYAPIGALNSRFPHFQNRPCPLPLPLPFAATGSPTHGIATSVGSSKAASASASLRIDLSRNSIHSASPNPNASPAPNPPPANSRRLGKL